MRTSGVMTVVQYDGVCCRSGWSCYILYEDYVLSIIELLLLVVRPQLDPL